MKPAAKGFVWGVAAVILVVLVLAITIPTLNQARIAHYDGRVISQQPQSTVLTSDTGSGAGEEKIHVDLSPGTVFASDRMIIRTGEMELAVDNVPDATARLAALAQQLGGYVEKSSLTGAEPRSQGAEIVLRVPAGKLDEAREAVRKLSKHLDSDSVAAEDVTRQYVDLDARLRNARALEAQYLDILKKAGNIDDIVQVTEKLNEVRGQIETMQSELKVLSNQIEMSTLSVKLHPVAEAQIAGVYWHPWVNIKSAGRDLGQGLANFTDGLIYFVIMLPLIALWVATYGFGAWIVWRIGRVLWRRLRAQAGMVSPAA